MTDPRPQPQPLAIQPDRCADGCCTRPTAKALSGPVVRDQAWLRAAGQARALSWISLVWMSIEGAAGITAGAAAGSIALIGWALSSAVEGLASVIVIWRFTGSRTLSDRSEHRAQKAVAISFWLLAPYIAIEAVHKLTSGQHPGTSSWGIALTAGSLLFMPLLGVVKRRLGARLDSGATAGEGVQNLLCAYLAGAVLTGLAANTALGWWWADPLIALAVAAVAIHEGRKAWHGDDCC